jgi:hypothetical protein
MNNLQAQRVMGISGLMVGLGVMLTIPLYFIYPGAPPAWNVLTRDLLNLLVLASMLIFFACFSHLIRRADATLDWLASILYGAGMLFLAVALVATANEAGVVFGDPSGTLDPTIDGVLAQANILMHGSIRRLLTVVMLVAADMPCFAQDAAGLGWAGAPTLSQPVIWCSCLGFTSNGCNKVLQRPLAGVIPRLLQVSGILILAVGIASLRRKN